MPLVSMRQLLDHAAEWHGAHEIVTRSIEGPIVRTTYAEVRQRAKRGPGVGHGACPDPLRSGGPPTPSLWHLPQRRRKRKR